MNKQFMVKMMRAKQLQYEALKEVMPETMLKKVTKMEEELLDLGKELISSAVLHSEECSKSSAASDPKIRKVTIE